MPRVFPPTDCDEDGRGGGWEQRVIWTARAGVVSDTVEQIVGSDDARLMAPAVIRVLDVAPRGQVVVLWAAAAAVRVGAGTAAAGEVVSWSLVLLRASAREGGGVACFDSVLDAPDEIL